MFYWCGLTLFCICISFCISAICLYFLSRKIYKNYISKGNFDYLQARNFLLSTGYSLVFGPMCAKTYRVHYIFTSVNQGKVSRKVVSYTTYTNHQILLLIPKPPPNICQLIISNRKTHYVLHLRLNLPFLLFN